MKFVNKCNFIWKCSFENNHLVGSVFGIIFNGRGILTVKGSIIIRFLIGV